MVSLLDRASLLRRDSFFELLLLFRYPPRSAAALLDVGFPLGAFLLVVMLQAWLLRREEVGITRVEHGAPAAVPGFEVGDGGDWISGPGGCVGRVRLNRKTPAHLVRHGILWMQVSATCRSLKFQVNYEKCTCCETLSFS